MGRKHAKSIRNAKVADILRKNNSFSVPSISSKNPSFGDFKICGVTENVNFHMGNEDSFSAIAEHQHEIQSVDVVSSDLENLKIFDLKQKSPAAVHPGYDVHGYAATNSNSLNASMNSKAGSINFMKVNDSVMDSSTSAYDDSLKLGNNSAPSTVESAVLKPTMLNSSVNSILKSGSSGNSSSWANLFKENRSFSGNVCSLREVKCSQQVVDLSDSIGDNFSDLCLLGSFSSRFPGKDEILKLRNSWNVKCHVHFHVSKWLIFKFDSFMDLEKVLRDGPYCFFGKPMRLFKMPRFFDFSSKMFSVVSVWVKLPLLPIDFWNDDDLSKICSFLGKPMYSDQMTNKRLCLDFARCLIEIDVAKNLPDMIPILLADGSVLHQPVVYEDLPFCPLCNNIGHFAVSCNMENVLTGNDKCIGNIVDTKGCLNNLQKQRNEKDEEHYVSLMNNGSMIDCNDDICFGSLDFNEAVANLKVSVKDDEEFEVKKADVVDDSLILKAENICEKSDNFFKNSDLNAELDDKCDENSVGVEPELVVVEEVCESVVVVNDLADDDVDEDVDDDDSDVMLGENLGEEELIDDVLGEESVVRDLQADLVVGCDGDENSAIDDDDENSEFDGDSGTFSGDVDVVNSEKRVGRMVSVAPNATFEEKISACKQAGMCGRLVSLGGKPFEVDLDLFDDSGRLLAAVPLMTVDGLAADGFEESDDDEYDSNADDDNDDEDDASDVESDENIEVNAENSRSFLRNYTLKVLKEAEEGGYIKCNVRPSARDFVRGNGIVLTEDDIDMDIHNEDIRLGKYKNGFYHA